jgi:nicotinate-nucleotide adenylyltransferase
MNAEPGLTGILGGTFDPVHEGHIAAALAASQSLSLDRVVLVPSHLPPHRPALPRASAFHRFAMVALAVSGHSKLAASDVELRLPGPSFTAVTLRHLQAHGYRPSQLFFIIGTDAFAEVASWHDYPAVLDLAHFVVISRPGQSFDGLFDRLPDLAPRMRQVTAPGATPGPDASCAIWLVNAATPDVSSTLIRERAAAGEPLRGLVASDVEGHIRKHRLYGQ